MDLRDRRSRPMLGRMSAENVAYLNGIYERWGRGDFRTPVSDGFTIEMGPDFPDAGEHVGVEGVAAYTRGLLEPWERLTIEAEEMFEGEDEVLVRVLQVGTGKSSGIPVQLRYFQLWIFGGPQPSRMVTIMDESDAMAHLGGG